MLSRSSSMVGHLLMLSSGCPAMVELSLKRRFQEAASQELFSSGSNNESIDLECRGKNKSKKNIIGMMECTMDS